MTSPRDSADPMGVWREWMAESERQWNSFLNEAMASEEFTRSMGQFMDMYLNAQKSMNEAMGRYFSSLNIPSRTDVLTLGERLSVIEEKLDSLSRRVDDVARQTAPQATAESASAASGATPRPPRTKKPPKAGKQ